MASNLKVSLNEIFLALPLDLDKHEIPRGEYILGAILGAAGPVINASGSYPLTDITVSVQSSCDNKEFYPERDNFLPVILREIIENSLQSFGEWEDYRRLVPDQRVVQRDKKIAIRAEKQSLLYRLVIEDNGIGIPGQDMSFVGIPNYTGKSKNGMGVALARSVVASVYHGNITYESNGLKNAKGPVYTPEQMQGIMQATILGRSLGIPMPMPERSELEGIVEKSDIKEGTKVTIDLNV